MNWLIYLLALAAGAMNPAQAGANSELKKSWGQPIPVAIYVYLSGLLGVALIQLLTQQSWPSADKVTRTPWWAWTGGLLSIAATVAGISFAQKLGSGVFTGLSVTASLITSVILDHFGWIGFQVHHVTWPRIAGCALMVGGLWMLARF